MMGIVLLFAIVMVGFLPLVAYLFNNFQQNNTGAFRDVLDMELLLHQKDKQPLEWWNFRRPYFNQGLLWSGLLTAVFLFLFTRFLFPDAPISLWNIFFLLTLYLIYMGAANLVYNMGSTLEKVSSPDDPQAFRTKAYAMTYWIAVLIPIFIALVTIISWLLF